MRFPYEAINSRLKSGYGLLRGGFLPKTTCLKVLFLFGRHFSVQVTSVLPERCWYKFNVMLEKLEQSYDFDGNIEKVPLKLTKTTLVRRQYLLIREKSVLLVYITSQDYCFCTEDMIRLRHQLPQRWKEGNQRNDHQIKWRSCRYSGCVKGYPALDPRRTIGAEPVVSG